MAGQRQPIDLVIAKNKKHLTKRQIEERKQQEVSPIVDEEIEIPSYLTKRQKNQFNQIANQLKNLKIFGNTDIDALARYIIAKEMYIKLSKKLNSSTIIKDLELLTHYCNLQDKFFKQARAASNDLGLTITSRCRLVIPKAPEPKENKFTKKFG